MIHLQQFNAYLKISWIKILFQFERWLAKNHGKEYKILSGWKNFFLTKSLTFVYITLLKTLTHLPIQKFLKWEEILRIDIAEGSIYFRILKKRCRDTFWSIFSISFYIELYLLIPFYSTFILKTQNCAHFAMLKMKRLNIYFYTTISRRAVLCDWVWRAGVHTGFHTITLVLYVGSLPNLATWFPCRRGRTYLFWGH